MKKLLILLSLTTAMTAFADAPTTLPASKAPQGNTEKYDTMNITATVITPLTVRASTMEFGRVIQGAKANAIGRYTITGEPGQDITVELTTPSQLKNTSNNTTLAITLTYAAPTQIADNGDASFNINGELTPDTNHSGVYEGEIIARVQYQ